MKFIILIFLLRSILAEERPEEAPPPEELQLKPWELPEIRPIMQDLPSGCNVSLVDLIFVLDESGSIGSQDFVSVRQFTKNVVNALLFPGTRVGVVEFNGMAYPQFNLNSYSSLSDIVAALDRLPYNGGGTNIAAGMNSATTNGFTAANGNRPGIDDVMVVMTDGQDRSDVAGAHIAAAAKGIKVIAIGVGPYTYYPELLQITGGKPSLVYTVQSFNNLSSIVSFICKDIANPCDGNPCENGGTCIAINNNEDYVCNCTPSYAGPQCQSPATPCWSNPCLNGGTCIGLGPTTYNCTCTPDYTGPNCDIYIDPCQSAHCLNGGTCVRVSASIYTCNCIPGYTGSVCQNPFCENGGKFSCECRYGFTGPLCDSPIDFCNYTNVLENGALVPVSICVHGACQNTPNGPVCHCFAGYTGQWCQADILSCASHPCDNGGTCIEQPGGAYSCCCDSLHTGINCENNVNFCENLEILDGKNGQPVHVPVCGPHGECVNTPSGAICYCFPDGNVTYTGEFCEDEIPYNCSQNGKIYTHNSTWVDGCDQCECKFGNIKCSHASWCPARCALYDTSRTLAAGLRAVCPPNQSCVPEQRECAKSVCDFPIGWCFPHGMVSIDMAPSLSN